MTDSMQIAIPYFTGKGVTDARNDGWVRYTEPAFYYLLKSCFNQAKSSLQTITR